MFDIYFILSQEFDLSTMPLPSLSSDPDPSKITSDQAAFIAQKDSANGKKTMKSYLWMVCGDEYDQAHPRD